MSSACHFRSVGGSWYRLHALTWSLSSQQLSGVGKQSRQAINLTGHIHSVDKHEFLRWFSFLGPGHSNGSTPHHRPAGDLFSRSSRHLSFPFTTAHPPKLLCTLQQLRVEDEAEITPLLSMGKLRPGVSDGAGK